MYQAIHWVGLRRLQFFQEQSWTLAGLPVAVVNFCELRLSRNVHLKKTVAIFVKFVVRNLPLIILRRCHPCITVVTVLTLFYFKKTIIWSFTLVWVQFCIADKWLKISRLCLDLLRTILALSRALLESRDPFRFRNGTTQIGLSQVFGSNILTGTIRLSQVAKII